MQIKLMAFPSSSSNTRVVFVYSFYLKSAANVVTLKRKAKEIKTVWWEWTFRSSIRYFTVNAFKEMFIVWVLQAIRHMMHVIYLTVATFSTRATVTVTVIIECRSYTTTFIGYFFTLYNENIFDIFKILIRIFY